MLLSTSIKFCFIKLYICQSDFRSFLPIFFSVFCILLLITRNSILGNMRDFNFVSIKMQSVFGVKFSNFFS